MQFPDLPGAFGVVADREDPARHLGLDVDALGLLSGGKSCLPLLSLGTGC
jgi:hypothetical protein